MNPSTLRQAQSSGLIFVALMGLVGCQQVQPVVTSPNAVVCLSALVSAGIQDTASIPAVALATPACIGLAQDVLKQLIAEATGQAIAARRAMRR